LALLGGKRGDVWMNSGSAPSLAQQGLSAQWLSSLNAEHLSFVILAEVRRIRRTKRRNLQFRPLHTACHNSARPFESLNLNVGYTVQFDQQRRFTSGVLQVICVEDRNAD
ncbi:MAG TPA: hypothetical protein VHT28_05705, partial [Silvibacterium sp.]|nr:hypothetical protein [Silvibacterium sp.]